ncbi:MAG: hypothetical protein Q8Q67_01685 [bacterium]|nr:hypothetical protein [bacterium]
MKKLLTLLFLLPLVLSACSLGDATSGPKNLLEPRPQSQDETELTPSTNKADTASPAVIQSVIEAEKE